MSGTNINDRSCFVKTREHIIVNVFKVFKFLNPREQQQQQKFYLSASIHYL